MSQTNAKASSKILSNVSMDKGFHFCTAEGVYTNVTATSLEDFLKKLKTIDDAALLFHYPRGDFQAWIRDVLGDTQLAERMCFVERNLSGQKLRKELQRIVRKRLSELKAMSKSTGGISH